MGQANSSLHLEQMRLPLLSQEQQPDSSQNISSSEAGKRNGFLMCSGGCELSDGQGQDEHELKTSKNKLTWVVIFCLVFMSVEIAGGILSNSLAVLTDAAHLLSDVAGFAISLFAIWASTWEATARQSYGYHRLEVLGALVSIQIIWLITGIIVYKAIDRILNNFEPVNGKLMFLIATFGLVVNIVMMAILGHEHGHKHDHGETEHAGHSHAHNEHSHDEHLSGDGSRPRHQQKHKHQNKCKDECGHNHDYDHSYDHNHDHEHEHEHVQGEVFGSQHDDLYCRCKAVSGVCVCISSMERETDIAKALRHSQSIKLDTDIKGNGSHSKENINVRGAYLHVLGDLIQSIGVMIGGAVIWYKPEWKIVDLICTLLFSLLVMGTTIKMLRDILEVLMESTPRAIDPSQLENGLKGIEGVVAVHDLHIWAITVGKVLLACHVTINSDADADIALQKVIDVCKRDFKICHVTIQIERGINSGV